MRVLLIDIGNSRLKWRIVDPRLDWPQGDGFGKANGSSAPSLNARFSQDRGSLALVELPLLAQHFDAARACALDAVHLSNVAGEDAEAALRRAVRAAWGDVPVHALIPKAAQCGVDNGYRDKTQLGPDRWAALLGAHAMLPDRHVLVCSFGTATTIDLLLSEVGTATQEATRELARTRFLGGLILPGFEAMCRSLARDTARLPLAQGEVVDFAVGTDDAIASGIAAAQTGAVMRALHDARVRAADSDRKYGAVRSVACVLAGGGANTMAGYLSDLQAPMYILPDLVLRGLHAVARDSDQNHDTARVHTSTLVREHR